MAGEVLFDAHLHADGLSDQDVRSMEFFAVKAALLPAHDPAGVSTPEDLLAHFDDLVGRQAQRLWAQGVRAFVALGVHPLRIPWHGLDKVLAELPRRIPGGTVVALGEAGLERGTEREEQALARQLELAADLGLPVLLHTPERDKEAVTKRLIALVRESGVAPERVLVDHVSGTTLRLVRACGFTAGLTVHPARLSAKKAVDLVRRHGSEGLVLSSDAGDGTGDILALPRTVAALRDAGVNEGVVRRVAGGNALAFYRIERAALAGPPARALREAAGRRR